MPMNISAGIVNFNRCRDMRGRSVVSEIGERTSIERVRRYLAVTVIGVSSGELYTRLRAPVPDAFVGHAQVPTVRRCTGYC